jgi:hypothetical protein
MHGQSGDAISISRVSVEAMAQLALNMSLAPEGRECGHDHRPHGICGPLPVVRSRDTILLHRRSSGEVSDHRSFE